MILFLFSVSIALLTFILLIGLIQKVIRPEAELAQRMKELKGGKAATHAQTGSLEDMPFVERVLQPAMLAFENYIKRFTPKELSALIAHRITMAGKGKEWSVPQFFAACLLGMCTMWIMMFFLLLNADYALVQKAMFLVLGGVMGGMMPVITLNIMIQKRQEGIQRQLPEVLDLLCVSVQAGLSFDASLRKIVERMKGPFVEECHRLQDDIRMGMARRTAMKNLASRCEVQDVSLFMTSLIQSERLGTSMGKTLKNQSDNIRERRRQYVKAEALKAPVKIVFPLVLFIFPALFVVTLVPTLLFLMKNM